MSKIVNLNKYLGKNTWADADEIGADHGDLAFAISEAAAFRRSCFELSEMDREELLAISILIQGPLSKLLDRIEEEGIYADA